MAATVGRVARDAMGRSVQDHLFDAEFLLNLLQRYTFGLRHREDDPDQLPHHTDRVERKRVTSRRLSEHGERPGDRRGG